MTPLVGTPGWGVGACRGMQEAVPVETLMAGLKLLRAAAAILACLALLAPYVIHFAKEDEGARRGGHWGRWCRQFAAKVGVSDARMWAVRSVGVVALSWGRGKAVGGYHACVAL